MKRFYIYIYYYINVKSSFLFQKKITQNHRSITSEKVSLTSPPSQPWPRWPWLSVGCWGNERKIFRGSFVDIHYLHSRARREIILGIQRVIRLQSVLVTTPVTQAYKFTLQKIPLHTRHMPHVLRLFIGLYRIIWRLVKLVKLSHPCQSADSAYWAHHMRLRSQRKVSTWSQIQGPVFSR